MDAVDVHEVELVLAVAVAASSRCSGPLAGKQQQWQRVAQGIAALRSGWWMSAMMSGPKRSFQGYKTMFAHGPAQWRGVAAEHRHVRASSNGSASNSNGNASQQVQELRLYTRDPNSQLGRPPTKARTKVRDHA